MLPTFHASYNNYLIVHAKFECFHPHNIYADLVRTHVTHWRTVTSTIFSTEKRCKDRIPLVYPAESLVENPGFLPGFRPDRRSFRAAFDQLSPFSGQKPALNRIDQPRPVVIDLSGFRPAVHVFDWIDWWSAETTKQPTKQPSFSVFFSLHTCWILKVIMSYPV